MPFVEALEAYKNEQFTPFHTPGHKIGVGAPTRLQQWMGAALPYDLGIMYALDDFHEPEGALLEAQQLAAELYGAEYTWFSVNGTTAIIESMIMGTVGEGDEIIIPREAHRSIISGLILSGATPIYTTGQFNAQWGVTLGTTAEEIESLLLMHPKVKAVVLVNPNYYGIATDIEHIIRVAHAHNVIVLVDEAHGAHLAFHEDLPISAVDAGADLVAQSTHKLIGSLTQTSMLHVQGERVNRRRITRMHQMLQSTSPNYIFLASLDMARHQMATEGHSLVARALRLARWLRRRLETIRGIRVLKPTDVVNGLDETKVLIDFSELGINGIEAEQRLRKQKVEVELVSGNLVLVLITIGDTEQSVAALVQAVQIISKEILEVHTDDGIQSNTIPLLEPPLPTPIVRVSPRIAFYREIETIPINMALGRVSGEVITFYPPGIPFIAIGEEITQDVLDYIAFKQDQSYMPNGASDRSLQYINVLVERSRDE